MAPGPSKPAGAGSGLGSFMAGVAINQVVRILVSRFVTDTRAVDYVAGRMYEDENGDNTWRSVDSTTRSQWQQRARVAATVLGEVLTPRM